MKKRILILGKLPPPYMGPAIATQIILNSSLNNKFELFHLDTRINRSLTTIGKFSIKKVLINISLYINLVEIIIKNRPNLVLVPISQATSGFLKDSFFIIIARIFRRKTLIQLRGSNLQNWLKKSFVLFRIYAEWIIRRCQGAIVLGNNLKYLFEKYFRDDKIFVVPNGANYSFPDVKKDGSITNILYLGNLMPSKGIQYVIDSIKILKEMNYNFSVDVVGDWLDQNLKEEVLNLVEKKNLPAEFYPPVGVEKKLEFLKKSDIFVFPPIEPEGHPWVIVEAMAAGLPIISTDQGAITESVIHGVNGFIVEKRNPEQIAEKIKYLIDNPEIRKKMGKKNRELYLEKFTEDKMVENLSITFKKVISGNS